VLIITLVLTGIYILQLCQSCRPENHIHWSAYVWDHILLALTSGPRLHYTYFVLRSRSPLAHSFCAFISLIHSRVRPCWHCPEPQIQVTTSYKLHVYSAISMFILYHFRNWHDREKKLIEILKSLKLAEYLTGMTRTDHVACLSMPSLRASKSAGNKAWFSSLWTNYDGSSLPSDLTQLLQTMNRLTKS